MGIKVAKFGGSSVADAIQVKKIRDIIEADKDIHYVIVSAPGKRFDKDSKITDLLYSCQTHIEHNLPYEQLFQVVCDRFNAMEMNLGVKINLKKELDTILEALQEGTTEDYIASRGEYLNARLIAAFLGFDFVDAARMVQFDAKGRFLEEETDRALAAELKKHERAVIPGFYGARPDGSIKTFSRGGSDITGAIVARAVHADVYENWTDVSGFLMADPRIVPNPEPISRISYKELRELSYMGASVLHEDAIYPARVAGIPINIRNTNQPQDPGTIITAEPEESEHVIKGIAGSRDFTVFAIYKNSMSTEIGFIRRLAGIFEDFHISIEHIPSGIDTVSVVVKGEEVRDCIDEIVEECKVQLHPDSVEVFEDIAVIATVGSGMSRKTGTSARLLTALARQQINIRMIDQGSSEMNIIVGVRNDDFETAIRAIYDAFVKL
ncbi:MAG: aspartate kinase [Anaerovoracaceae bacterium]|jgi:aspartate kinase